MMLAYLLLDRFKFLFLPFNFSNLTLLPLSLWNSNKPEQSHRSRDIKQDIDPKDAEIPPTIIVICTDGFKENVRIAAATEDTFSA